MLNRTVEIRNASIVVEQDLSLSHAGTVWDGALVLAYFLQKNQQLALKYLKDKAILELGSGTGILGLAIASFQPKIIYLSDLQQYLPILKRNLQLNHKFLTQTGTKVQAIALKWGDKAAMTKIANLDVIIGSELAYDSQNITSLLQTLLFYHSKNPNTLSIISYQKYLNPQRNLLKRLGQMPELSCLEVEWQKMNQEYRDQGIGIIFITGTGMGEGQK